MITKYLRCIFVWAVLVIGGCGGGDGSGEGNALSPGGSSSASKSWGTAALLEASTDYAEYPDIAVDTNGNAIAVWQQGGSSPAAAKQIFASRYTAAAGWGSRTAISGTPASAPQVAMCGSGNAFAAWLSSGNVWAVKYTASTGWGTPTVIEGNAGEASGVYLECDAIGNAYVLWSQFDNAAHSVYANRYVEGAGWAAAVVLENDTGNAYTSALVVDSSGVVTAVWEQSGTGASATSGIRLSRYTSGLGWSAVTTLVGTNNAAYSDLAVDGSGNAEMVWAQSGSIYASRYTGGSWSAAEIIESGTGDARLPNIAFDASGNALVVWEQHDGAFYSIYANRYVNGSGWGQAVLVESGAGNSYSARVAIDVTGAAMAVWINQTSYYDIYASRYASGAWGAATLLEGNAGSAYDPQVAFDSSGNVFAVWYQFDPTISNIWINRYQ